MSRCLNGGVIIFFSLLLALGGCKEEIDESNFAMKTEETMTDYLVNNPDRFSAIKTIFDRVKLGSLADASTLTSVLAARGNYTLFAPNNEAITNYLKELGVGSIDELTYEQALSLIHI